VARTAPQPFLADRDLEADDWHTATMHNNQTSASHMGWRRTTTIALALAASLMVALPAGLLAADDVESAPPSVEPAQAACESAGDLELILGFLQDIDVEDDGWVPVLIGGIAGLSEARTLVGFVGETYQPLLDDLVVSFQEIRVTAEELSEMETTGAQIAAIGETVTEIGISMNALTTQLRANCPTD
jgi:hypothetical protein